MAETDSMLQRNITKAWQLTTSAHAPFVSEVRPDTLHGVNSFLQDMEGSSGVLSAIVCYWRVETTDIRSRSKLG